MRVCCQYTYPTIPESTKIMDARTTTATYVSCILLLYRIKLLSLNVRMINTSASERTRQLRLLRGLSSAGEKVGSYKSVYSPGLTLAALPKFFTKLDAGTRRESPSNTGRDKGPISLNMTVINPIVPTGDYNVFTFTPTVSGWYYIVVDGFGGGEGPGGNDMDLAIGNGNTPLDIPFLVNYDLNENYDTPPETDYKVFSFSGSNSDEITSYFIAGQTYQVLVIGYDGDGGGTYTLSVFDNTLLLGSENAAIGNFFYTGSYQLYQYTATQSTGHVFTLEYNVGPQDNRSDIFISTADTDIDIQGCIDYENEEGPLPDSVLIVTDGPEGTKIAEPTLENGSTYQVLIYQYNTGDIFEKYSLSITL